MDVYENAKQKLTQMIEQGNQKSRLALQDIMTEHEVRKDFLVPSTGLNYQMDENGFKPVFNNQTFRVTDHSYRQLLSKANFSKNYADYLSDLWEDEKKEWAKDLFLHNLRELTESNINGDRLLFRTVQGLIKGCLSSSYKRIDASPIFEAFLQEGMRAGFKPIDGVNTNSQYNLKMIFPKLYEPIEKEYMVFGLSLSTSDYGKGAMDLKFYIVRMWCVNGAIGESFLRKVHLGRRFTEEDQNFSQETYELDTKTVSSAIRDIVSEGVENKSLITCDKIQKANEKEIDVKTILSSLRKKGVLNKDQANTAESLYNNVQEITLLPQDKGAWRFSNVLSLMANNSELDRDKSLELQETAYDLIEA